MRIVLRLAPPVMIMAGAVVGMIVSAWLVLGPDRESWDRVGGLCIFIYALVAANLARSEFQERRRDPVGRANPHPRVWHPAVTLALLAPLMAFLAWDFVQEAEPERRMLIALAILALLLLVAGRAVRDLWRLRVRLGPPSVRVPPLKSSAAAALVVGLLLGLYLWAFGGERVRAFAQAVLDFARRTLSALG